MPSIAGRAVIDGTATNKSGGAVAKGDVVIVDTSNDHAFTTTTTGQYTGVIGVVVEENGIANNASGRVQTAGYVALVNVPASVTRGHYLETHTVAKQAVGNATRRSGSFGQFYTGGTTPTALLFGLTDVSASGSVTRTTLGYTTLGGSFKTARGLYLKKITVATAGYLQAIHAGVKGNAANGVLLSAAIMSDNSGTPLSVIAVGSAVYVESSSGTLVNLGLSATARFLSVAMGRWLPAADYWLVVALNAAADSRLQLAYDATTGSTDRSASLVSPAISDQSFNASTNDSTMNLSIYGELLMV